MSALNVTQAEADVLLDSLKMFAEVHKNAGGAVPPEVAELLTKLTPEVVVAEVVVSPPPVVEEQSPVAEESTEETKDE